MSLEHSPARERKSRHPRTRVGIEPAAYDIKRIASDFEARWCAGQHVDLGDYLQAVNVQRRVLATLGLQRRARDVSPSLSDDDGMPWSPMRARFSDAIDADASEATE
jgi:hypothetical protein